MANGYDVYAPPLCWSPDGRLLAAAVNTQWPRDDTLAEGALRLYGRNGEIVAELATGVVGTPSFSPDGKRLAAVVNGNLAVYKVTTGQAWQGALGEALTSGSVLDCRWQGKSIFCSVGPRFYGSQVVFVDLDYPDTVPVIMKDEQGGSLFSPIFSSDGAGQVALGQNVPQTAQAAYERLLVNTNHDGLELATKPQHRPDDYHESNAFFLDDHTVLFQRGGWGDWRLYRVDLNTSQEYLEVSDAQQPALDASRRWLAFTRRNYEAKAAEEYDWELPSAVILRDREKHGEWLASTPGVYAELPALSPDGVRLAWLEQGRDGQTQVGIRTVAGVLEHGSGIVPGWRPPVYPDNEEPTGEEDLATETTKVVLETTKGDIVLAVHPDWSPLGAAHFLELVQAGFYDGAPWFRVIDGFVAQCGVAADPAVNKQWSGKTIKDEPVVVGNPRGMVAFGKSGAPNSRSTHIFINFRDNSGSLDPQGFSAFAEVAEGMDVADSLTRCEYNDQGGLAAAGGLESFKKRFPAGDYITRAYVAR